jgi:hypothetical protein
LDIHQDNNTSNIVEKVEIFLKLIKKLWLLKNIIII